MSIDLDRLEGVWGAWDRSAEEWQGLGPSEGAWDPLEQWGAWAACLGACMWQDHCGARPVTPTTVKV